VSFEVLTLTRTAGNKNDNVLRKASFMPHIFSKIPASYDIRPGNDAGIFDSSQANAGHTGSKPATERSQSAAAAAAD